MRLTDLLPPQPRKGLSGFLLMPSVGNNEQLLASVQAQPVQNENGMQMTVAQFANEAISRMCPRCRYGDPVWPPDSQHPEPCPAHEIHKLLEETKDGEL